MPKRSALGSGGQHGGNGTAFGAHKPACRTPRNLSVGGPLDETQQVFPKIFLQFVDFHAWLWNPAD